MSNTDGANQGTAIPGEVAPGSDEERVQIEDRARLLGWKDKSEFDREPGRWVDAKTFIERGEASLPVTRENLRRVEGQLGTALAQNRDLVARTDALLASVDHLRELALNGERNAFERAQREFAGRKAQLETAIDEGAATADVAKVKKAREALSALQQRPPAAPASLRQPQQPDPNQAPQGGAAPQGPQFDPVEKAAVEKFVAAEPWFRNRDRDTRGEGHAEASAFATAHYTTVQRDRPDLTPTEQLAEVKKSVEKRFPEIFGDRDRRPSSVAAPSGGNGEMRRNPTSAARWEDIPVADRAEAEKMLNTVNKGRKDGKTMTKAEYAAMYVNGTPGRGQ